MKTKKLYETIHYIVDEFHVAPSLACELIELITDECAENRKQGYDEGYKQAVTELSIGSEDYKNKCQKETNEH